MALTEAELGKIKTLLAGEDGKLLQAWKDTQVAAGLKAYSEKNPTRADAGKKLELLKTSSDNRIKELEIKNTVLKKCYIKGIDPDTVEALGITFNDEDSIDSKLDLLQKKVEINKTNELNDLITKNSFRPGSGIGHEDDSRYGLSSKEWDSLSELEKSVIASRGGK